MTLLAILTGGTFVHYLFGGSVPIMGVFLTMVGLDLFTGYTKALNSHTWVSSINLNGLFTKFITFSTIICAAALDKLAPIVGIALPINVALIWTALLILYEIGSILENAHAFGLKIAWLQKWLRVFERDVGEVPDKDDQENNVQ
ncbi:MAG: phage holin family protein [Enterococcus sp.]